ncbi:MAG: acetyl-CoA carboxylase carboxyltransferase subunit alpha [Deferribacterota bacterium]|nr:acetyl-CoA carboxylase carboxyltransferase subunit alpha [Deferribacterota bacterium]
MDIQPLVFEKDIVELEKKIDELKSLVDIEDSDLNKEIENLESKLAKVKENIYKNLTPAQKLMVARHPNRPYTLDYARLVFKDFIELHGDRLFADDLAIVSGIAKFEGEPLVIVGHQKGRKTKENIKRNFGMANPEGYRKALRIFYQATKFNRPIITFVDTPGANPGIGAEERGQAEAIARNLKEMAGLTVPIITIITGEGGSGGALGIAVANRVLMLEHSTYSVISAEGCASILWKDASYSDKAAENLKLTAQDIIKYGVIDEIIKEPSGGAHRNHVETAYNVGKAIRRHLDDLKDMSEDELVDDRVNRFRKIGIFGE